MNWEFGEVSYAYLFLLLPFLIWRIYFLYRWKKITLDKFADIPLQKRLFKNLKLSGFIRDNILILQVFIFIVLALMDLKGGVDRKEVKREGIDIIFAIDVSRSMDAKDIAPSRIEKAKKIVNDVVQQLGGDRIGIVIFAGKSYSAMPLSDDYNAAQLYLGGIGTHLIFAQGTNIAEAVSEASNMLSGTLNTSKALVLLSDGEAHKGNIEEAVKVAKNNNITIFSIGLGTHGGAPIPLENHNGYKRNQQGDIVLSRLEESSLKQIASQTKGIYLSGNLSSEKVSQTVFDSLSKLSKIEQSKKYVLGARHFFYLFVIPALVLLIIVSLTNYKNNFNV